MTKDLGSGKWNYGPSDMNFRLLYWFPQACLCFIFFIHTSMLSASPYQEPSWSLDSGLVAGGVGLFAVSVATDANIQSLSQAEVSSLSRSDINAFDRGATSQNSPFARNATAPVSVVALMSPLTLLTSQRIRKDWGIYSLMYLEVFLLAGTITDITKNSVQRIRPYAYNPKYPEAGYFKGTFDNKTGNKDARRSFFSSDVSMAFSLATLTSIMFEDYYPQSSYRYCVWGATLGYASMAAYLRYASGWHYPTDIISGAAVGVFIGWMVPWLHRKSSLSVASRWEPRFQSRELALSMTF
jgi:membrane-associated phospholipid phosphatase